MHNCRSLWVSNLIRIANPVLSALARGELHETMPVESVPGEEHKRRRYSHLEALGRTLGGLAPWLEVEGLKGEEAEQQAAMRELARGALVEAFTPNSPDALNFSEGQQPLVDAAMLCLGFLRAPEHLWRSLPDSTRDRFFATLELTRDKKPHLNNWQLFPGLIEAFLGHHGKEWNPDRVERALNYHQEWYLGDGVYGDGPKYHADYYNSFVIHPFLLEIERALKPVAPDGDAEVLNRCLNMEEEFCRRARRYAALQEHMISPDGSVPPIGRSLTYRFGVLHLLAMAAWRKFLPSEVHPAQVRGAMTAVQRRLLEAPNTFDSKGWLRVGFCGHQPELAESYISTGSLYLCTFGFLTLGLPPEDSFWSDTDTPWTSCRIYCGETVNADKAVD